MLHNQNLCKRKIVVLMDRQIRHPHGLPEGHDNIGLGLGFVGNTLCYSSQSYNYFTCNTDDSISTLCPGHRAVRTWITHRSATKCLP
jgi:hypothetical protein